MTPVSRTAYGRPVWGVATNAALLLDPMGPYGQAFKKAGRELGFHLLGKNPAFLATPLVFSLIVVEIVATVSQCQYGVLSACAPPSKNRGLVLALDWGDGQADSTVWDEVAEHG